MAAAAAIAMIGLMIFLMALKTRLIALKSFLKKNPEGSV